MLSILLIYFVYKYFRDLARKYKVKQEWKYSLTGVVAYFGFQFLFFFVWGVVEVINNPNYAQTDTSFNSGVGFLALLFGMLMLYFLHKYLEKRLQKQQEISPVNEIENIGVSTENEQKTNNRQYYKTTVFHRDEIQNMVYFSINYFYSFSDSFCLQTYSYPANCRY